MVDEHGPTREDYMVDLERLLGTRYIQSTIILIWFFSSQLLKPFQAIAATLMVYDFINLIPRQVRVFCYAMKQ